MALHVEFNQRSARVKVTPGTVMFEVLETARAQLGLDASLQYQLLHRGRPVELSIPFRLTGVSNNAALELRELGTAEVQQVRVCVQLPDGKRLQAAFAHDSTLESLLAALKLLPSPSPFSLSFLRREIEFAAFSTTTLKDLGLLSGSAIFRVQGASAAVNAPIPPKRNVSFEASTSGAAPPPPVAGAVDPVEQKTALPPAAPPSTNEDVDMQDTAVAEAKGPAQPTLLTPFDALQLLRDSHFDSVSKGAVRTLMKIVANILSYPDNEKMRSIRVTNAAFQRSVGQCKGGLEFLAAIGFQLIDETQTITLPPISEASKRVLEDALQLLYKEADDLGFAAEDRSVVVAPPSADPDFDVFKPQITRMQMQPRGPSTTEVLVDALKTKQDKLLSDEKPARNTTVALGGLRSGAGSRSIEAARAEDRAGPSDSQLLIASMKARRSELEKSMNFRTQAMRELDDLKRKKVFQTAVIRVQFPDKVVLQATFHPNERVQDVIDHVKESLASVHANLDFYLYVSPPFQKLPAAKTLTDSTLVPAALVYLSWQTAPEGGMEPGFYLRQELLDASYGESKDESSSILDQMSYPKPLQLDGSASAAASTAATAAPAEPKRGASSSTGKSGKKPAWLKL